MARTILDVTDQAFRLVQRFQDGFDNLQVGPLIVSANIVNLTDASLVENQIDRLTMIGYVQPVADVRAVTVYRKLLLTAFHDLVSQVLNRITKEPRARCFLQSSNGQCSKHNLDKVAKGHPWGLHPQTPVELGV